MEEKENNNKVLFDFKETLFNLKRSLAYAKDQKWVFLKYSICSIILCIIGAIVPLFSAQQLIKLNNNDYRGLLYVYLIITVVEISRNLSRFLARKFSQIFFRETLSKMQFTLASEVLKIETSDLDKKSSGVFIDRLVKDSSKIADIFMIINDTIIDVVTNIGILFAIFVINKVIFVFFIVTLTINFILKKIRMQKYFENDKQYRKHAEKTTGLIGELVRGVRDIKVLNAEDSFTSDIRDKINKLNQERYEMSNIARIYDFICNNFTDIFDIGLILLCIFLSYNGHLSIDNFIIIYMYSGRVENLLHYVASLMEHCKDFNLSANRVFEIIDEGTFKKEKFGTKNIGKANGDFEFKNVSFSYDGERKVLDNMSFKVNANETVSFVGKSGAGKSTIFSLLAKLYNADSGTITIDGVDINELDKDSIRGNISIITQNPYIFNMTIKENLQIVKKDITDEEIIEACKMACLHEYIETLPDGYDTLVGEGGLTLSGGQKQRLAIARAFVQKTEIILFDEATSALDNETQRNIQQAIDNLKKDYTILIIAHRLSTVINSDKIMYIDDGKVICEGTHKELLKKNKAYKELYDMELKKEQ